MKQFFQSGNAQSSGKFRYFAYCPYCGAPLKSITERQIAQYCEGCHFIPHYNPSPGVVIMIVKEGKVLLGRRASRSFRSKSWCLPGGFMEFDENFLVAAHREVLEETGLLVEIQGILNVVSNFLSDRLHTLVIVMQGFPLTETERPGDDVEELRWFPIEGPYPTLAFEADEFLLQQYASGATTCLPIDPRYRILPNTTSAHSS